MKALLYRMDRAEDYQTLAEMDMEFHAMVVDAAGSPALKRTWENLRLVEWDGAFCCRNEKHAGRACKTALDVV